MRFSKAVISVVASIVLASSAEAQSIWTGTNSDNWSNAANWNGGIVQVSGDTLQLVFNADGTTTYTANNDIGPFTLNSLTFANTSNGPVSVAGNSLTFAGVNPAISTSTSGSSSITAPIIYAANTAITNSGAGTLTLGAQTFADGATFTNSGSGTLVLSAAVAYTGTNVNINLANTGTGTLNIGNLTAGGSGHLNITAGAVKFPASTA